MALAALVTLSATPARAQIEMTDATGGHVGVGLSPLGFVQFAVLHGSSGSTIPWSDPSSTGVGLLGDATTGTARIGIVGVASPGGLGTAAYGVYGTTGSATGIRYAGYFAGNVTVTGTLTELSDGRFKVDVRPLGSIEDPQGRSVLGRVLALEPRAYRFTDDPAYASLNLPAGEQYGFLAQEVATVFPDLVREGVHPAEGDGEPLVYQAVDYVHLVPVLVQALQEQQAEIAALRTRLDALDGGGG